MKNLSAVIFLLLLQYSSHAQAISLLNSSYKLNSISRADMGMGISRNCHNIFIPYSTSQLVMSIGTSKGEYPPTVSLTAQVLDYYSTAGVPVFSALFSSLHGSGGQASLSMYVYDHPQCAGLFVNYADRQCRAVDVTENTIGGIFYFSQPVLQLMRGKNCSFCILNNESLSANYYHVELTAITE